MFSAGYQLKRQSELEWKLGLYLERCYQVRMRHLWIISFEIVFSLMRTVAVTFALDCTGENIREKKLGCPRPSTALLLCQKIFQTTAMILVWLRIKSLRATKNKRLFIFKRWFTTNIRFTVWINNVLLIPTYLAHDLSWIEAKGTGN